MKPGIYGTFQFEILEECDETELVKINYQD